MTPEEKLEIIEKVNDSINKRIEHLQPSPETARKLQKLEDQNMIQNKKIDLMACQVDEMYKVFTSTNFVIKFTLRVFGLIGVVTGGIIGILELIKRTK